MDSRHTRGGAGILHVASSPDYTDQQQMFAAGYLEGWLTAGAPVYPPLNLIRAPECPVSCEREFHAGPGTGGAEIRVRGCGLAITTHELTQQRAAALCGHQA